MNTNTFMFLVGLWSVKIKKQNISVNSELIQTSPNTYRSLVSSQRTSPLSASRRFIQFLKNGEWNMSNNSESQQQTSPLHLQFETRHDVFNPRWHNSLCRCFAGILSRCLKTDAEKRGMEQNPGSRTREREREMVQELMLARAELPQANQAAIRSALYSGTMTGMRRSLLFQHWYSSPIGRHWNSIGIALTPSKITNEEIQVE